MNTASRWALAGVYALVVGGYALASSLPIMLDVPSRATSVPYRAVVLGLSLVVFWFIGVRQNRLHRGLFWIPLLVFWTMYAIRLILDTFVAPVPLRMHPAEYFAYSIGVCMIPMLALLVRPDAEVLRTALRSSTIIATAACLIALYLNFSAILRGDLASVHNMRLSSETLNPIALGNLGVSVAVLALFLLVRRRGSGRLRMPLLLAVGFIGVATIGLSASRGPVLSLAILLPLLVWLGFRGGSPRTALVLASVLVLGAYAGAVYIERQLGFGVLSRIESLLDVSRDESAQVRVTLYENSWSQFLESPFIGHSLDEQRSGYHPHNPVLESFMATGFLGGTAFCLVLIGAMAAALRILIRQPQHGWVSLLYIQYLINAMLSGSLYLSADMWGLAAACVAVNAAEPRLTPMPAGRLPPTAAEPAETWAPANA